MVRKHSNGRAYTATMAANSDYAAAKDSQPLEPSRPSTDQFRVDHWKSVWSDVTRPHQGGSSALRS